MALHVTESNATAVRLMWKAWQASNALAANREAQPVYQCRLFTTDVDGKQIGEWQDMDKGFYDQYDPYCRRILYAAPPAPAVPPEKKLPELMMASYHEAIGWNECRAAMLAQPVSQGYKLVPVEPTSHVIAPFIKHCCENEAWVRQAWREILAAAPEGGK